MAKRLTDTEKFTDPWFRRLSSKNKLLWDWILCSCDHAGIITIDLEFVEMVLKETYEDDVLENHFSERIIRIGDAKYFIPKFLRFQYGKLNPTSKVHASVIAKLRDEGILYNEGDSVKAIENNARSIGYGHPLDTDKEKKKEIAIDKDIVNTIPEKNLPEILPQNFRNSKDSKFTPHHLEQLWNDYFGKTMGFTRGIGSGIHRENFLKALCHLPTEQHWRELFDLVLKSPYLTGKNARGWKVDLLWLVDHDNALKVLNGRFDPNNANSTSFLDDIKLEA